RLRSRRRQFRQGDGFRLQARRRIEHYGRITSQTGVILPPRTLSWHARWRWTCPIRFASVVSARQTADDLAQPRFTDLFRRLRGRKPLDDPLLFLRPLSTLARDFQRKHAHVTDNGDPILQSLFIGERANGAPTNRADHASLLKGFARRRILRRFALLRPTLRDDPAPAFPRCDEHELRPPPACAQPVGQGAVLHALYNGGFTRVTHLTRAWTKRLHHVKHRCPAKLPPGPALGKRFVTSRQ